MDAASANVFVLVTEETKIASKSFSNFFINLYKSRGESFEFGECGQHACTYSYKTTRCDGRLILPCDLLERLDFGTTRLPTSVKIEGNTRIKPLNPLILDQHKHRARSIRNTIFNENQLDESIPFLEMTAKNTQTLREIHKEHAERKKRFVDGNRQLEMKIYCEK